MADQVDEVKSKTDIVGLISEYLELKKAGINYKALCPFHSEKTPSFVVSQELQIFKCFGCGESGDAISFLEKHEGMDFYEALKYLADRVGVTLTPLKGRDVSEKEKLYRINSLALRFYHWVLLSHPQAKKALDYVKVQRHISSDTIKKFQIGYSPDVAFAMKRYLVDKKKILISDLERVGIIYKRDGQAVDRFKGRVIFPLHDHRGNVVGFAGRILPANDNGKVGKYINTPETEIYHKSNLLFGLHITKGDIKKKKTAVVVEGELDAISSWQAGIKNVVAIKGSALTDEQVRLLRRLADTLVLALDADIAGDAAARRGIEIAERQGLEVKVVKLIGFKDPDEAAQKAPEKLTEAIDKAMGVWDFVIDSVFSRHSKKTGTDKAKISKEVVPLLSGIQDKIVQAHYVDVVAKKLEVPVEAVTEQINHLDSKEVERPKVEPFVKPKTKTRRELLEERYLSIAFRHDPKILIEKKLEEFIKSSLAGRILAEFKSYVKTRKSFDPSVFASELPRELVDGYLEMVLKDLKGLEGERPERLKSELELLIREIKILDIKTQLTDIAQKIKELEKTKQKKDLKKAEQKFGNLTKNLNELEAGNFKGIIL